MMVGFNSNSRHIELIDTYYYAIGLVIHLLVLALDNGCLWLLVAFDRACFVSLD